MIIGAILISLAILVIMVVFVTRPLYKAELVEEDQELNKARLLTFEYQQILSRIRDLELEHQEGKTSEGDYHQRREILNKEAAELLQELDSEKLVKAIDS